MKCPKCNKNIPDGSMFCNHCGQRIEEGNSVILCPNSQCGKEIPSDSKFCPFCGKPLYHEDESLCLNEKDRSSVIIAYQRLDDDDDDYADSHKNVTIFKDSLENVLYSGVVKHNSFFYSLEELKQQIGNKTVINLECEFGNYLEVSATAVREIVNSKSILWGNYHGNKECNGFEVSNCGDLISQRTKKRYDGIFGNFLINFFENGEVTYHDIYDRDTEEKLYSRIPIAYGNLKNEDDREYEHWLQFYCDEVIMLVNRYSHFYLDENEVVVENFMYDNNWQSGYKIWSYSSRNRILTTFRYDEYEPRCEGIKMIRMRDEHGNIINEINADGLFLKGNFQYNKCLAIKEMRSKNIIVYIDENGNTIQVPNIRLHGEPEDFECFFVTDNVIVVNDEDGATMLTTKGEVIFDSYRMRYLSGCLVEYYDLESGHCGVIDSTGKIIIPALYDTFDVISQ